MTVPPVVTVAHFASVKPSLIVLQAQLEVPGVPVNVMAVWPISLKLALLAEGTVQVRGAVHEQVPEGIVTVRVLEVTEFNAVCTSA
jgi:hypothetical protein